MRAILSERCTDLQPLYSQKSGKDTENKKQMSFEKFRFKMLTVCDDVTSCGKLLHESELELSDC